MLKKLGEESKSLKVVQVLLQDYPCSCGGAVSVSELAEPPMPDCAPIIVMHTQPYCVEFGQREPADFVTFLLKKTGVSATP